MRAGIFSQLRGPDGRRLSIVLAAVFAIATLISGINAGFAAAADGTGVICRADGVDGKNGPSPAAPIDHLACCIVGHDPSAAAAPPERAELTPPSIHAETGMPRWTGEVLAYSAPLASEGPRGPPPTI